MLDPAVRNYLEIHRAAHLDRLIELLRIPGIANRRDDACDRSARWLADALGALGFHADIVPTSTKPVVLAEGPAVDGAPTILIYGHYDVQPPEPLELWRSDPFQPVVRDGWIYARGADDDKGQLFTHLMAVEAFVRSGKGLPLNVKFYIEGEEEIGSPSADAFLAEHGDRLAADACVISDSAFFAAGLPSLTCALRGLAYVELTVTGPSADVHSGLHGGLVANPVNALAAMVAAMHHPDGRVAIPGFYDDVESVGETERAAWSELPFDEAACAQSLGLEVLAGGEKGLPPLERNWARPTLDCNGILGGYTGEGSKTIIPARASAKISMRLVARQDPQKVLAGFRRFVDENTPPGLRASVEVHATSPAVQVDLDSPAVAAAREALAEAFGRPPVMIRCGASVPATEVIQRRLGLHAVLMGFGLPEDNLHSPNERFALSQLYGGSVAAAAFLQNLAAR